MELSSLCVKENATQQQVHPHILPIYASSSYVFEDIEDSIEVFEGKKSGYVYSRYGNPTVDSVNEKIRRMESIEVHDDTFAAMTSSGMSAISTLLSTLLNSGDAVLTQANIYGGSSELLYKFYSEKGIKIVIDDFSNLNEVKSTLEKNPSIKLIFLETPTNPTLDCVDLRAIASLSKDYGVTTMVDNTFCTPLIQRPLGLGIDFVIHSTTKYLNGHGNSIAGAIIGHSSHPLKNKILENLRLIGSTCNPWDAWLTHNGLKTLALRMKAHSENSLMLAEALIDHPKIGKINHLGIAHHPYHDIASKQMSMYGGMMSFEVGNSIDDVKNFVNNLRFITQAPTLGDVDTLILHPATSSHRNIDREVRLKYGISDTLVRVSVGIEAAEDIIADVIQALNKI